MSGSNVTSVNRIEERGMVMIVNPSVSSYNGESSLADIPMLQALGYDNFSYRYSWRTKDTRGRVLSREPGAYSYFSLADDRKIREESLPETLACITAQDIELTNISISSLVNSCLEANSPKRLCIVSDTSSFTLKHSGGRPLCEQPYFGWERIVFAERVLKDVRRSASEEFDLNLGYCTSWSQIGWAVSIGLVADVEFSSLDQLMTDLDEAPYLNMWDDVAALTFFGEDRADQYAAAVSEPWMCLSRHYGIPVYIARRLWDRIDARIERLAHTYVRMKRVESEFGCGVRMAHEKYGEGDDLMSRLVRQSMVSPDRFGGGIQ